MEARRAETAERILRLKGGLGEAARLCEGKACVYMTGSYARGESSARSDLDLFLVDRSDAVEPTLSHLDSILVQGELIRAARALGLPEFSGDGRYLVPHRRAEMVGKLGQPDDDVTNLLTARLLLLLESKALVGEAEHREAVSFVLQKYWRDHEGHAGEFMPAFLANDILRLWRTFCVNYEARTETTPDRKKAKRRLHNYKLKHSRMLTCYSALLNLLGVYRLEGGVSRESAEVMCGRTPTERLEWLLSEGRWSAAHRDIRKMIVRYEEFLEVTDAEEGRLIERFLEEGEGKRLMQRAYDFGDLMCEVLAEVGAERGGRFYRLLVV